MNLADIKELIKLIEETDVTELTLENKDSKIVIRKGSTETNNSDHGGTMTNQGKKPSPSQDESGSNNMGSVKESHVETENLDYFTSQMVGTFYSAPKPDAKPYVKVGDKVSKNDTICIIEAMKLFNEIKSDFDAVIKDVLVEDGEMVEYGQKLFAVEKLGG